MLSDCIKVCITEQPYNERTRHQDDDGIVADWLCVDSVGPVLDLSESKSLEASQYALAFVEL